MKQQRDKTVQLTYRQFTNSWLTADAKCGERNQGSASSNIRTHRYFPLATVAKRPEIGNVTGKIRENPYNASRNNIEQNTNRNFENFKLKSSRCDAQRTAKLGDSGGRGLFRSICGWSHREKCSERAVFVSSFFWSIVYTFAAKTTHCGFFAKLRERKTERARERDREKEGEQRHGTITVEISSRDAFEVIDFRIY